MLDVIPQGAVHPSIMSSTFHLEQAIAVHERIGAATWVLRSRYELACVRLGDPARRAAAVAALADVASEANRIGMLRLSRDAEQAGFRRPLGHALGPGQLNDL